LRHGNALKPEGYTPPAVYPARWKIVIKTLGITPLLEDQELTLTPVTSWEGAVSVAGSMGRRGITGKGYVELVGYDTRKSFGTPQSND